MKAGTLLAELMPAGSNFVRNPLVNVKLVTNDCNCNCLTILFMLELKSLFSGALICSRDLLAGDIISQQILPLDSGYVDGTLLYVLSTCFCRV